MVAAWDRTGSVKRFFKSILAILVIGALTGAAIHLTMSVEERQRGRRGSERNEGPVPVVAAQARLADVPVWLEGVGTAKARNTVTVRPQVDGRILSIEFEEGEDVKRGDVLAQIDPATYQAQLDQALAKKSLDEAQLANARLDLERYLKLSQNVISAKTVDTQRALVEQLEAQVKSDQGAIDNARALLGYTTIVAPIDGRTGLRLMDVGNLVRASDAGIVVITEVRPISVLFTLPQQQLPQINKARATQALTVQALETDSDAVLDTGVLQVVDNQVDQSTGTIRLKADFPNTELQLWPGQFVNVRLLLKTLQNVVVVPTAAIQRGPDGAFVYVIGADQKVAMRPVTVTQQNDVEAVVAEGLAAAETVVTAGFGRLKDGAEVKVGPEGQAAPSAAIPPADATGAVKTAGSSDTASIDATAAADEARPRRGGHRRRQGKKEADARPDARP
jgi:multidrug efflux system membrane fusion protein